MVPENVVSQLLMADIGQDIEGWTVTEILMVPFPCGVECCGYETLEYHLQAPWGENFVVNK